MMEKTRHAYLRRLEAEVGVLVEPFPRHIRLRRIRKSDTHRAVASAGADAFKNGAGVRSPTCLVGICHVIERLNRFTPQSFSHCAEQHRRTCWRQFRPGHFSLT